jgi:thiamine biosynthesis lipoprotein
MGGTFTVVAYDADRNRAEGAIAHALEEAVRLDQLLSNYRPSSEWSKVNREAARGAVSVSEELFALLQACQSFSGASEGAFDITVGPLMKIWGFYRREGKVPHRSEIRTAMESIGYRNIQLDPKSRTVRFARPGIEMDPGGIGKGYAVDCMVEVLKREGIRSAFVTAATSSIYGLGAPPSEPRGWQVTIRHPRAASKQVEQVYLRDNSLSTSGSQEKFFEVGGKIYTHIMNPATGYPSEGRLQVSVLAPRTLDSEAWTKPIFIHGRQWAAQRKPKDLRAYICEDTRELSCAWLQ